MFTPGERSISPVGNNLEMESTIIRNFPFISVSTYSCTVYAMCFIISIYMHFEIMRIKVKNNIPSANFITDFILDNWILL